MPCSSTPDAPDQLEIVLFSSNPDAPDQQTADQVKSSVASGHGSEFGTFRKCIYHGGGGFGGTESFSCLP